MIGQKYVIIGQIVKVSIQFLGLVCLSRLVEPIFFGFIALQITVLAFLEIIRDWGMTTHSLQGSETDSNRAVRERAEWFLIGLANSILIGAIYLSMMYIFFPSFQGESSFCVLFVLASIFIANALGVQAHISLSLERKFGVIAIIETIAQGLALLAALAIFLFFGPLEALAGQLAALAWCTSIGKVLASSFSLAIPTLTSMKSYFRRGLSLTAAAAVNYWNFNVDNLIVSAKFGFSSLGLYSRAFQVYMVPVGQLIWPLEKVVLVNGISHAKSGDLTYFAQKLQRQLQVYAVLIFAVLGVVSKDLLPMLLGANWADAAPLLSALCLSGFLQIPNLINVWIFLLLRANATVFVLSVIRVTLMFLSLFAISTQLETVPYGIFIANLLAWIVSSLILLRFSKQIQVAVIFIDAAKFLTIGLASYLIGSLAYNHLPRLNGFEVPLGVLQTGLICGLLIYLLGGGALRKDLNSKLSGVWPKRS